LIYYLATAAHLYTIRSHLHGWGPVRGWGRALSERVTPLSYEELFDILGDASWWDSIRHLWWPSKPEKLPEGKTLPLGTYLFTDLERLSPYDATRASIAWSMLQSLGAGVRLINHPTRSMRRYELLRTLYENRMNRFNVYRLTEARWPRRYPVFIRGEDDHEGPRSPLLQSRQEVEAAIAVINREGRSREGVIIVEFCDTADENGIYRKYSVFVVGSRIFPKNILFSHKWAVKGRDIQGSDLLDEEERRFIDTNPHETQLRRVCELACIGYGRIDYAVLDGEVQVWEINTNPMITLPWGRASLARALANQRVSRQFENAFDEIDRS
jgi:hypothetical protein